MNSISSNSLANRQFLALAKGEINVQKERNPFQVARMEEQERYCLHCFGKRHFDVIFGRTTGDVYEKAAICRCCGKAIAHPDLVHVKWIGG